MTKQIVVVGASLSGLRAVEQLRAHGWKDAITVVGAEPWMPYNRVPLSKQMLSAELKATKSLDSDFFEALALPQSKLLEKVEWQLGNPAVSCSIQNKWVSLADGNRIQWDGLVIATGLRPRKLSLQGHDKKSLCCTYARGCCQITVGANCRSQSHGRWSRIPGLRDRRGGYAIGVCGNCH